MKKKQTNNKGRGALYNPHNRFDSIQPEKNHEIDQIHDNEQPGTKTKYITTYPKTIINKVASPDIGMPLSLNPYQGCEHGCIYCYARNSHEYWGYSAGLEFEEKILIKKDAPKLLIKTLNKKNYKVQPIMLAGNTDCYQPAEKKYKLTRQILEILWKYKHPVGIITKNHLIQRDIDLLKNMATKNLVKVSISITTSKESLRRKLEPRTSTFRKKIETVKKLSAADIPVNIMMAPIIPSLNDDEIMKIAQLASNAGALSFNHTIVRLNGVIGELFTDWVNTHYPHRANRILNQIKTCHGGKLNNSNFKQRMKGTGNIAQIIHKQVSLGRKLYFKDKTMPHFDETLFYTRHGKQLSLFS